MGSHGLPWIGHERPRARGLSARGLSCLDLSVDFPWIFRGLSVGFARTTRRLSVGRPISVRGLSADRKWLTSMGCR